MRPLIVAGRGPAGLRGGDPGADEQVGFAGAGVAEQHDGFASVDPVLRASAGSSSTRLHAVDPVADG